MPPLNAADARSSTRFTDPCVRYVLELSGALSEEQSEHLASCKRIGPDWI